MKTIIIVCFLIITFQFRSYCQDQDYSLIGADISKLPLSDEEKSKLTEPIDMDSVESFLQIVYAMLEKPGQGFVPGDTAFFSIWNDKLQKEEDMYAVIYHKNGGPDNKPYVEVLSGSLKSQKIGLKRGWNIFSTSVDPAQKDMKEIMSELINNQELISVQDETGNTLENWGPFGGWVNNIGNLKITEGYKISVNTDCELSVIGYTIQLPLTIPLLKGWNTISYPKQTAEDGMQVLKPLIDDGTLEKAQDEKGNTIEYLGIDLGWKNSIGNFEPGEGYQIKVNKNTQLVVQ